MAVRRVVNAARFRTGALLLTTSAFLLLPGCGETDPAVLVETAESLREADDLEQALELFDGVREWLLRDEEDVLGDDGKALTLFARASRGRAMTLERLDRVDEAWKGFVADLRAHPGAYSISDLVTVMDACRRAVEVDPEGVRFVEGLLQAPDGLMDKMWRDHIRQMPRPTLPDGTFGDPGFWDVFYFENEAPRMPR